MHMEEKKCKSTYVKEVISIPQNLILKQKRSLTVFMRILFMKGPHLCFTDLIIALSLLNIIYGTNLTWYEHVKTKTVSTNLINLTHCIFQLEYFVICLFILFLTVFRN